MTGVKMGDRVAQVGCAHGGRLAAVAAKVGLSGRAVAFVPDEASAARARKARRRRRRARRDRGRAADARCRSTTDAFDLVVVDDTGGLFGTMRAEDRVAAVRELLRVLRPGGRVIVIGAAPRGGLGALFARAAARRRSTPTPSLEADGFKPVRTLAERDGLVFVEGVKPKA